MRCEWPTGRGHSWHAVPLSPGMALHPWICSTHLQASYLNGMMCREHAIAGRVNDLSAIHAFCDPHLLLPRFPTAGVLLDVCRPSPILPGQPPLLSCSSAGVHLQGWISNAAHVALDVSEPVPPGLQHRYIMVPAQHKLAVLCRQIRADLKE